MLDKKVGDEFLWELQQPLSEPIPLTTEGLGSCLRCDGDNLMSPGQALKSRQKKTPQQLWEDRTLKVTQPDGDGRGSPITCKLSEALTSWDYSGHFPTKSPD